MLLRSSEVGLQCRQDVSVAVVRRIPMQREAIVDVQRVAHVQVLGRLGAGGQQLGLPARAYMRSSGNDPSIQAGRAGYGEEIDRRSKDQTVECIYIYII